jgi:hypothetical protein
MVLPFNNATSIYRNVQCHIKLNTSLIDSICNGDGNDVNLL